MPILIVAFVVLLVVVLLVESGLFAPRHNPTDSLEKEFRDYVARELHKANDGAANAEAWAIALVKEWRQRQGAL